jgi:hypothetical protein
LTHFESLSFEFQVERLLKALLGPMHEVVVRQAASANAAPALQEVFMVSLM